VALKSIKSRRVIRGDAESPSTIIVEGESIKEILPYDISITSADIEVHDYGDLVIMPGIVDTHVHINEPGRTEWEGFETATAAAAKGGITTLVDMPLNCDPVTTTKVALEAKLKACSGKLHVDCGFYGGVIPGNAHELEAMIDTGVLGFKSFLIHSGIDEFPHATEADIRKAIPILKKGKVPYLMHAELDFSEISAGKASTDFRKYETYLNSRPRAMENNAIELMARLAGETNAHLHVVHLSSTDRLDLIESVRAKKIPLSVETCHHYLCFCSEEISDGRTEFKCAPPIRERENREKLWQGLKSGTIDFAVSDHSPCTPILKKQDTGDFMAAWGGIAGLQLSLSVFHTEATARGVSLPQIAHYLSTAPARFVGLSQKGEIAVKKHADFAIFNPAEKFVVKPELIAHRHEVTPYMGRELAGAVTATWLRGQRIFGLGASATPSGQPLLRGVN